MTVFVKGTFPCDIRATAQRSFHEFDILDEFFDVLIDANDLKWSELFSGGLKG